MANGVSGLYFKMVILCYVKFISKNKKRIRHRKIRSLLFWIQLCKDMWPKWLYNLTMSQNKSYDTTVVNILVHISFRAGAFISVGQLSRGRQLDQSIFCTLKKYSEVLRRGA